MASPLYFFTLQILSKKKFGGGGVNVTKVSRKYFPCFIHDRVPMLRFFEKKLIITLVFEKNANFFVENWQKSQKIVIMTSTPGFA
jgi:hypothetical protein